MNGPNYNNYNNTNFDLEDVPESYQKTISGDRFMICDSLQEADLQEGRVIVFATRKESPKNKWYEFKERLRNMVESYGEYIEDEVIEYLRTLANTIILSQF